MKTTLRATLAALFAAATTAVADLYATLTVNGTPYNQGGAGWTFDGVTVSLTNAGPFVLSTGGANFTSNVAVVAQSILYTTDLLDWEHAVEFLLPGPPFDFGGIILQHSDSAPARFYRLKATQE